MVIRLRRPVSAVDRLAIYFMVQSRYIGGHDRDREVNRRTSMRDNSAELIPIKGTRSDCVLL